MGQICTSEHWRRLSGSTMHCHQEHDIEARQALLLVKQGRSDEALKVLRSCLAYWNRRGHPRWIATTTKQIAILEASVGHVQAARKLFGVAADEYEKVGDRFDAAKCLQASRVQSGGPID